MRRLLTAVLILTFLVPTAFAAGSQEAASQEDAPQELRIMWWGSQTRHERTIEVIDMYAEQNNVEVTHEFAGWNDYWTKLTTMAAGRNLPDVIQLGYPHLGEWQGRGLLTPLDQFVEDGVLDLSDIPDASLDGGRVDGELYGMSLGINSWGYIIDLEMFEEAGIPVPEDDWTWEEFENTVLRLHEELGVWGFGPEIINDNIWRAVYLSRGMTPFAPDGSGLGYTDDEPLVEYLEMALRLQEAGAIPHISVAASDYDYGTNPENDPMIEGDAAMTFFASNQLNALWTAAGGAEERNLQVLPIPRSGDLPANWLRPSQLFAVTRDSNNPALAADFINFFVNDIEANEVLNAERGVPAPSDVRESLSEFVGKPGQVTFDFLGRVAENSIPIPPPPPQGWSDVRSNVFFPVVRDGVLFGEYTPEEAARLFREEADSTLQ